MAAVLDHVFICTAVGASVGDRLRDFGVREGSPNRHPGQGTACRRFFFRNAMLELLWVADAEEARASAATRLWERWSSAGASPFGIILRPASEGLIECPFRSWQYRPAAMPDLVLEIAADTGLGEPMWCFNARGRAPAEFPAERLQPIEHPAGVRAITGIRLFCPSLRDDCVTQRMANAGHLTLEPAADHWIELEFDGGAQGLCTDFRPGMPLVFRQ